MENGWPGVRLSSVSHEKFSCVYIVQYAVGLDVSYEHDSFNPNSDLHVASAAQTLAPKRKLVGSCNCISAWKERIQ